VAGKVIVGLQSHWQRVRLFTDCLFTYGLNSQSAGDEHPTYAPLEHGSLYFFREAFACLHSVCIRSTVALCDSLQLHGFLIINMELTIAPNTQVATCVQ